MANLTVTVDEQVLKRARIKAIEQGTSVTALVSDYLARFAGMGATEEALAGSMAVARGIDAGSGPEGRTWRRDDLYDRPVLRDRG